MNNIQNFVLEKLNAKEVHLTNGLSQDHFKMIMPNSHISGNFTVVKGGAVFDCNGVIYINQHARVAQNKVIVTVYRNNVFTHVEILPVEILNLKHDGIYIHNLLVETTIH